LLSKGWRFATSPVAVARNRLAGRFKAVFKPALRRLTCSTFSAHANTFTIQLLGPTALLQRGILPGMPHRSSFINTMSNALKLAVFD
jgi:hypothetical protein